MYTILLFLSTHHILVLVFRSRSHYLKGIYWESGKLLIMCVKKVS